MKHEVIICDICGKPIDYKEHRKFKIKVQMKDLYWDPYVLYKWDKLDVHDECFREFCRLIALEKEKRERDFDKLLKSINAFAEAANKSLY